MANLKIWDGVSALTFPNGTTYTAEDIYTDPSFGFTPGVPLCISTSRGITSEISAFGVLCGNYNISEDLSDEEALAAINAARDAEAAAAAEVAEGASVEERNTAALEFIAMSLM